MATAKTTYPEIGDIREDLHSLKDNTVKLGRHLKEDSVEQAGEVGRSVQRQAHHLMENGEKNLKIVEKYIAEKPVQSIAIAFGAGLLASMLLGRR